MTSQVTRKDVLDAQERIAGSVERTPLVESEVGGRKVWLKCENLQTGGAFKLRGASNRLLQLSEDERAKGVVAFSSGNHARGVAIAAKRLGIRAVIVMPSDAPAVKVEGTRAEGAEIIFFDRYRESREDIAARISAESGATVVPSFDDPHIVAGQGTVGLEILEQMSGAAAPDHHSLRRRRAGCGHRAGMSGCRDRDRRAGRLGRHAALAGTGRDRAGRLRRSSDASAMRFRHRGCRRLRSPSCRSGRREALSASEAATREAVRWAWRESPIGRGAWGRRCTRGAAGG